MTTGRVVQHLGWNAATCELSYSLVEASHKYKLFCLENGTFRCGVQEGPHFFLTFCLSENIISVHSLTGLRGIDGAQLWSKFKSIHSECRNKVGLLANNRKKFGEWVGTCKPLRNWWVSKKRMISQFTLEVVWRYRN